MEKGIYECVVLALKKEKVCPQILKEEESVWVKVFF